MNSTDKIIISLIVAFGVMLGLWLNAADKVEKQKREITRVKHNYDVAQDSVRLVKGENGLLAARIRQQDLTVEEIRKYQSDIVESLKEMKIQLKKVSSITAFNTETTNNFHTFFRDSTLNDTVKIETLTYKSRWLDLDIVKKGQEALVKSVSRDSLIQVVHWDYKGKFWPTRWMTRKEYWQDIKSNNPGSVIKFSKWIVPYKKKR